VSRWTSDDSAEEQSNDENDDTGVFGSESEPEDNADNANTSLGSAMDVDELPPTNDDDDDPSDVAMVPMADLLNARWGSGNVSPLVYDRHLLSNLSLLNNNSWPPIPTGVNWHAKTMTILGQTLL